MTTTSPSGALGRVDRLIRRPVNERIRAWKDSGRPVIGYFCPYIPPELILAAGALPLRLRGAGSEDTSPADVYMSGRTCTYVRHVMSLVLEGEYDFLDGEISLNTCDHVRRASDVFVKKSGLRFHGFLSVPRVRREAMFPAYHEELRRLAGELAEHLGAEVSDDSLRQAIAVYNGLRERLRSIEALQRQDPPRLSGAESLAIHVASQVMPPEEFIDLADELLAELAERPVLPRPRARLLLIGAELDEPAYVAALESTGALVVADRLCFGARSVLDPIDPGAADPLEAIARACFFRPSCARMIGDFPARWAAVRELARSSRAEGIVFARIVFCDPWGADLHNFNLRTANEADALPLLALSREYGIVATGQLRTRVQAFCERIEMARARHNAAKESL